MLPIIEVQESIRQGMLPYRSVFCRQEGFNHVSRYVTGLMISPNKTLQGIYDLQVWGPGGKPTRRAMHAGVFEARRDNDRLMALHRAEVAREQGKGGRQVISLDGTLAHHDRGPEIFANTRAWDYVEKRMARFQTREEAVTPHFRLSCVPQSLLQRVSAVASKSERFEFAKGQITFGQRVRAVAREVFGCLLKRAKQLFDQGKSWNQVLEALMPA